MADKIIIEGIHAYNGEWDFDSSYFTNRELHTIKQIAGVRAGELVEALQAGDSDMVVALAAIALQRNGKTLDLDLLWDAPGGSISYQAEPEEEDALPPESGLDSNKENNESGPSSEKSGSEDSTKNPDALRVIGPESSDSSASGPATSATLRPAS